VLTATCTILITSQALFIAYYWTTQRRPFNIPLAVNGYLSVQLLD
jgi:hypothetical protein